MLSTEQKNRVDEGPKRVRSDAETKLSYRLSWSAWRREGHRVRPQAAGHVLAGSPPSEVLRPPPTSLPIISLRWQRGKQKWGSYASPSWATAKLAGSFGQILCEVILCVPSDLILIPHVVLYGAAHYLCFSRTVPLYPLQFPLVSVSFLNYA